MKSGSELYFIIHYAILLSVLFDVYGADKKTTNKVMAFWAIFLALFGGMRWEIGGDWTQYYEHFKHSEFSNVFSYTRFWHSDRLLEWGFVLINATIKFLFGKFFIYNLIICSFIQYSKYKVCKILCPDYALTAFCMLSLLYVNYFAKRTELGVTAVLWSLIYIKNKKLVKFSIINYLGFIIHHQCIAMVPAYWIGKIKLHWILFLTVLIISYVSFVVFQDSFILLSSYIGGDVGEVALQYTEHETTGHQTRGITTLLLNLIFACVFLYIRKMRGKEKDEWYNALLNMFLLNIGIQLIFSNGMDDISRVGLLFVFSKVLLMIDVIRFFKERKDIYNLALTWSAWILYLGYRAYNLDSWYFFYFVNVPYKTIFDYNIFK